MLIIVISSNSSNNDNDNDNKHLYCSNAMWIWSDVRNKTNMIQIKHCKLRIPTGGRLSITQRGGVEFEGTEDKSMLWQGGGAS